MTGAISYETVDFNDKQVAHTQFWNRYNRPPKREYWDYIVERRDLLVPQDVRERKGSYFTPQKWVELSQQYIAAELGEDWQDEYYVWDCAAGTGNLLAGLTNKYNVWASTIDPQDVKVIHDLIANNKLNLLESHVFQFDFLNDDFSKLPQPLQEIINDEEKRKKLVVYINPPYAEVSSKTSTNNSITKGKKGVNLTKVHSKYKKELGTAGRELFTQFLIRIYHEIPSCILAEFSKLKILQGSAFSDFRKSFRAKLGRLFLVPAKTFDNVKGKFPIGFFVWNTSIQLPFIRILGDVYDADSTFLMKKIFAIPQNGYINKWISEYKSNKNNMAIGYMDGINGNDMQHNNIVYIINNKSQLPNPRGIWVNSNNIIPISIYLAVRKCIPATWINDRDQFLYPNDSWLADEEFQSDCLAYTLFDNNIQSEYGVNHWIPFTEQEVDAKEKFESHFMVDYIKGKNRPQKQQQELWNDSKKETVPLRFSPEAQAVMDAGRELWKYYHAQPNANPNAALYDIRRHFQGANERGKMNADSEDTHYMELISALRQNLKVLAQKIEPKVYEYGFLLK